MNWKKIAASTGIAFASLGSIFAGPAMANYDHNNRYDNDWNNRHSNNNRIVCVWVKDHHNNYWGDRHDNKKLVCFVFSNGRYYSLNNYHWSNYHWDNNHWDNNHNNYDWRY